MCGADLGIRSPVWEEVFLVVWWVSFMWAGLLLGSLGVLSHGWTRDMDLIWLGTIISGAAAYLALAALERPWLIYITILLNLFGTVLETRMGIRQLREWREWRNSSPSFVPRRAASEKKERWRLF